MKTVVPVLLILAVSAMCVDAKTRRSTSRSGNSKTTVSASAKGSSKVAKSAKGKSRKRSQTARRSAPRQSAPTPERYMEIQQALANKGFFTGEVNGVWGADSVDALKKFQAAQNLSPDGKLGALSLIALGLGPKREPIAQFSVKPESNP
jgi:peptidoglycan hydrolase-like protein with peptidoglycan-binding domain